MVKGHQHGVLHLVVPAAIAAGTLLTWHELQLELNEVVWEATQFLLSGGPGAAGYSVYNSRPTN